MQAQQRTLWLSGQQCVYRVRRSRRARRLLLHVDLQGGIEVVVPWHTAWREAERFVHEKHAWVMRVLAENAHKRLVLPRRFFVSGEPLPILGEERELLVTVKPSARQVRVSEKSDVLIVAVPPGQPVRAALERWYRRQAGRYFMAETARLAGRLHVAAPRVVVSGARTQWGSCSPQRGRISLNWRLMLGPRTVADYVIAHEIAHLKVRQHSARFWRLVGELVPGFEAQRAWLKRFGYTLVL